MTHPVEIIKLGGSLLAWDGFPAAFRRWYARTTDANQPHHRWVIAGGGALVDQIRRLDDRFGLPSETAHWAAIAAMDLHAAFCSEWLNGVLADATDAPALLEGRDAPAMRCHESTGPVCLQVTKWLQRSASTFKLPESWRTTSDSIAAAYAMSVGARQLTLLKSCEIEDNRDLEAWSRLGLVDPEFPRLASLVPTVRWVCLKNEESPAANR